MSRGALVSSGKRLINQSGTYSGQNMNNGPQMNSNES